MEPLDRRRNAFRLDLADQRLEGKVDAERFVAGEPAHVIVPVADVHSAPDHAAGMDTQFLHGDRLRLFDRRDGWAWVQSERDSYVGYVAENAIRPGKPDPSHRVRALRSFAYSTPDLKTPPIHAHSLGAAVKVTGETHVRGTRYALLDDGSAMIARHLRSLEDAAADFVDIAELFLHTPYLWGGASGFGIDCSGLVQLSMLAAGQAVLRDTDMQAASIGQEIAADLPRQRGDLVFWRGHVAIHTTPDEIIHANGYTMTVARETLAEAVGRIEPFYGLPIAIRRP